MLLRLVPPRVHAYLDDGVVLLYLMGSFIVGLRERAMAIALMGAVIHFFITRFTNYPAGTVRLLSFKAHGAIELFEGLLVLAATWLLLPGHAPGNAPLRRVPLNDLSRRGQLARPGRARRVPRRRARSHAAAHVRAPPRLTRIPP